MKWQIFKATHRAVAININKGIIQYDPEKYTVRIVGTEKDPFLYIYNTIFEKKDRTRKGTK